MSRHRLTALTLSPLHVGDGTDWTPESFRLTGSSLIRFDPAAVLAGMDDKAMSDFLKVIDRPGASEAELRGAQEILRRACRSDQERERIAVSDGSLPEIRRAIEDPGRRGGIHPFTRAGGRPSLPGSAVKGAIRTALLSAWAQPDLQRHKDWLRGERVQRGKSGKQSTTLQKQVLGETDSDPFRFIRLSDTELPPDRTRIERVLNWKRKIGLDEKTSQMQMHFECLRPGTRFTLELQVRDTEGPLANAAQARVAAEAGRSPGKAPRRMPSAAELFGAVNDFYRARWAAEQTAFFAGRPWFPRLPATGSDSFPLLLRVGRFSHFESASIEGLRQGWQPQNGGRVMAEGSIRAVSAQGGAHVPFGWLLLVPEGREDLLPQIAEAPQGQAQAPTARSASGPARGPVAPRGLAGRRGTVDDEPVEVVSQDGDELTVRFLESGDIEPVTLDEFKPED